MPLPPHVPPVPAVHALAPRARPGPASLSLSRRAALVDTGGPPPAAPAPATITHGIFRENGLEIRLLPPGVHWAPILTPDSRPICIAALADGTWLDWRPLALGADPAALEDEMSAKLEAHLGRRPSALRLL